MEFLRHKSTIKESEPPLLHRLGVQEAASEGVRSDSLVKGVAGHYLADGRDVLRRGWWCQRMI